MSYVTVEDSVSVPSVSDVVPNECINCISMYFSVQLKNLNKSNAAVKSKM